MSDGGLVSESTISHSNADVVISCDELKACRLFSIDRCHSSEGNLIKNYIDIYDSTMTDD